MPPKYPKTIEDIGSGRARHKAKVEGEQVAERYIKAQQLLAGFEAGAQLSEADVATIREFASDFDPSQPRAGTDAVYQPSDIPTKIWTDPSFRSYALSLIGRKAEISQPRSIEATSEITSFLPGYGPVPKSLRGVGIQRIAGAAVGRPSSDYVTPITTTRQVAPFTYKGEIERPTSVYQPPEIVKPYTVKQPRFVMVKGLDGLPSPVYAGFSDEIKSDVYEAIDNSDMGGLQKLLYKTTFEVSRFLYTSPLGRVINEASQGLEEAATQDIESLSVGGAILGLMNGLLQVGIRSPKYWWDNLTKLPQLRLVEQQRARADAVEAAVLNGEQIYVPGGMTPASYIEALRSRADAVEEYYEKSEESWVNYTRGLGVAWDGLVGAVRGGHLGTGWTPANAAEMEQRSASEFERSILLYNQASNIPIEQESRAVFQQSVEAMKESIEAGRHATKYDPLGSYTWASQPERYDAFIEAVALYQLQTGKVATQEQIRQIKELYVNGWTELVGQSALDATWMFPNEIFGFLVKGAKSKVIGQLAKVAESPVFLKLVPFDSPLRFWFSESYRSVSTKLGRTVFDTTSEMSRAYGSFDEFKSAMDEIGEVTLYVQRSRTDPKRARAIFDEAQANIPGLKNITFEDFLKFSDAGLGMDPTQWSLMLEESARQVETLNVKKIEKMLLRQGLDPETAAIRAVKEGTERARNIDNAGRYINIFSEQFTRNFLDSKRIYKGSILLEDTVAGWIARKTIDMSKKTVVIDGIAKEVSNRTAAEVINGLVTAGVWAKGAWATAVLTLNPGYIIRNILDSTFRDAVYGGNMFDDIISIFSHTQSMYADDLGFIPIEFSQSLARADLSFSETVASRILYEDWKPGWGLFSYFGYEYERLKDAAKAADAVAKRAPGGAGGRYSQIWDGLKTGIRDRIGIPLASIGGGMADFNTSVEFTLRLRMFHREYFKIMEALEPEFAARGIEALSPQGRRLAEQIWQMSHYNPSKLSALTDRILGATNKSGPVWASVLPEGFGRHMPGGPTGVQNQKLMIRQIADQTEAFIMAIYKDKGRLPEPAEIDRFIASAKSGIMKEAELRIRLNIKKNTTSTISTEGKIANTPSAIDLSGSAPIPTTVEVKIPRRNPFKGPAGNPSTLEGYTKSISNIAEVTRVPGKGVLTKQENGKIIIEVGDDLLKQRPGDLYSALHNATIDALKLSDTEFILNSGFRNLSEYKTTMQTFLSNPMEVRNTSERLFLALVDQMESKPQIAEILRRTGKVTSYQEALNNYRAFGAVPDFANMDLAELKAYNEGAQEFPPSAARRAAGIDVSISKAQFAEKIFNVREANPELWAKGSALIDKITGARATFFQDFMLFHFPGPKRAKVTFPSLAWDLRESLIADAYRKEEAFLKELDALFETNPEQALARINEISQDPVTFYLNMQDVNLVWDPDHLHIVSGTWIVNGEERTIGYWERIGFEKYFYSREATVFRHRGEMIQFKPDGSLSLRQQMVNNLRDVMGVPNQQAGYIMNTIDNQAQWAAKASLGGLPVEKYYERLGFVSAGDKLAESVIRIEKDGRIVFYGTGNATAPELVEHTSVLFYEDLVEVAKHNPDEYGPILSALDKAIGHKPGTGKLSPGERAKFRDIMIKYIIDGSLPNVKYKKPFESYKGWLTRLYDGIQGSPLADDLTQEVAVALDKMFIHEKMANPPSSTARKASAATAEMAADPDFAEWFKGSKLVNDDGTPLALYHGTQTDQPLKVPGSEPTVKNVTDSGVYGKGIYFTPDRMEAAEYGSKTISIEETPQGIVGVERWGDTLPGSNVRKVAVNLQNPMDIYIGQMKHNMKRFGETAEEITESLTKSGYDGVRVFNSQGQLLEVVVFDEKSVRPWWGIGQSKVEQNIQAAWDAWKLRQDLDGFPESALSSTSTMKAYLQERIDKTTGALSDEYSRRLWQIEQFENSMLDWQGSVTPGGIHPFDARAQGLDPYESINAYLFPPIPDFQMDPGAKTWIRNNVDVIGSYEGLLQELDDLAAHLKTGNYITSMLPQSVKDELTVWKDVATRAKAELISTGLNGGSHGGRVYEGAVDRVNRVMIDYNHNTRFDALMKNVFPFWTFPSRSWPFWAETLVTHPQIIAAYQKMKRMSDTARKQAGAVTSDGRPLPSLKNYIPIPGTDLWFNPMAPFSASYVLNIAKDPEDFLYELNRDDDVPPQAWLAKNLIEAAPVFGFSVAPWIGWGAKEWFGIPDYIMPPWPLIPQISLLPRWSVMEMIHIANKINFFGTPLGDAIYPEVSWHDYLVERDLLEKTNQQIQNMSEGEARKLVNEVAQAISEKGDNAAWLEAYKETSQGETMKSWGGYFTGIYTKEFSDMEADLLALRNENNLAKSALNNHFQAAVFDLPLDPEEAFDRFNSAKDTPEGWLYRLYSDIGYVTDADNQFVKDPKERARLLADKIQIDQNQSLYYQKVDQFIDMRDEELRAIGIGAPWEKQQAVYERFSRRMASIEYLNAYESKYGTNAPIEIIEKKLRNKWFGFVMSMRPRWRVEDESYDEWQKRVEDWEAHIPHMSMMMSAFMRSNASLVLHEDQKLADDFYARLAAETTPEGILAWRRQNDSIFDAMNEGWQEKYWNPYWDMHKDPNSESGWKSGYEYELADRDFAAQYHEPTAEEIYDYVSVNYPGRFSFAEVKRWVEYVPPEMQGKVAADYMPGNVYDIAKRQLEEKGQEGRIRDEIWNALSYFGPGKNRSVLSNLLSLPDDYTVDEWYNKEGTLYAGEIEKLIEFRDQLYDAIAKTGLPPATRDQLIQFIQAEQEQAALKDFVAKKYNITVDTLDIAITKYNETGGRNEMKVKDPAAYQMMRDHYNSIRPVWATQNPIWAQYYLWKPGPPDQLADIVKAGLPLPESILGGEPNTNILPGAAPVAPAPTGWPSGFKEAVGPNVAWEVSKALEVRRPLSPSAIAALRAFAQSHPEWADFVAKVLAAAK